MKLNIRTVVKIARLACLVFLVFVAFLAVNASPSFRRIVGLSTKHLASPLTELYFDDHLHLPTDTTPNIPYNFTFTIHNLEYKDMVYPYEVYISSDSAKQVIATGEVNLHQNESKRIYATYVLEKGVQHEKVVVNLTNKNQQIIFWIGKKI